MLAYHFLKVDMTAGSGNEPPWIIGETRKCKGRLKLCANGYHYSPTPYDALNYAPGAILCLVEVDNTGPQDATKGCSRKRRLLRAVNVERTLRLSACRIAEDVLQNYETSHPNDKRIRQAIDVAKRYADGLVSKDDLSAAESAARSAAESTAESAARSAARSAAESAADAARSAARSAAESAARSAARSAADAARSAAESAADAARSAAESAADAARSAADAARSAAEAKYRNWINEALLAELEIMKDC